MASKDSSDAAAPLATKDEATGNSPMPPIGAAQLTPSDVNAVAVKIDMPTIDRRNIEGWFLSLDYWFPAMGIKSHTQKFNTVMAALGPRTLQDFLATLGEVPDQGRYEFVKQRLITFCTDSQQRRLNQVLNETQLGDQRPSQLFTEMMRLVGDTMRESAVKNLWAKRLPVYAQAAVAACSGPPEEYLKIADAIVDTISLQVNSSTAEKGCRLTPASATYAEKSQANTEYNELQSAINALAQRFDRLYTDRNTDRKGNRSRFRQQSRERRRSSTPANLDECWYHRKFGSNSKNCRPPCKHYKTSRGDHSPK
ncbi:PREDICTED: uncharacterized protein LOC108361879 [Rhagoletis zephyria]|uniref:uncharacterized protein LOC108361879 n=1 Tax=Rhagoletis zephyria TaxID=28612 RepID=UPI00081173AD|nr:PREDICTED: uncharacterized protein LOC108361879 [Rhagoletis zephyria]